MENKIIKYLEEKLGITPDYLFIYPDHEQDEESGMTQLQIGQDIEYTYKEAEITVRYLSDIAISTDFTHHEWIEDTEDMQYRNPSTGEFGSKASFHTGWSEESKYELQIATLLTLIEEEFSQEDADIGKIDFEETLSFWTLQKAEHQHRMKYSDGVEYYLYNQLESMEIPFEIIAHEQEECATINYYTECKYKTMWTIAKAIGTIIINNYPEDPSFEFTDDIEFEIMIQDENGKEKFYGPKKAKEIVNEMRRNNMLTEDQETFFRYALGTNTKDCEDISSMIEFT